MSGPGLKSVIRVVNKLCTVLYHVNRKQKESDDLTQKLKFLLSGRLSGTIKLDHLAISILRHSFSAESDPALSDLRLPKPFIIFNLPYLIPRSINRSMPLPNDDECDF